VTLEPAAMSNVTYLPWVTPEPDNASNEGVAAEPRTDEVAEALLHDDELARLDTLVIRKLTAGDLSAGEVRVLLMSHGLPERDAEDWLHRYERLGCVNDERLAELLVAQWTDRKGKGRGAIAAEMRRRLISPEAISQAVADLDDDSQAERATEIAIARARQLNHLDRATAERRLAAFLSRRGFSGSAARSAIRSALETPRDAG